jgi:hypothetical protein
MTWTELRQTSFPARPDRDDVNRDSILSNYLSSHLEDLRYGKRYGGFGVEIAGREVESELARKIVDAFLDDLDDSLSAVSDFEAKEKLVYFDHPTQEFSYLSQAQERWQVDYKLLDYIYRRCLYSHLYFALNGYRSTPPQNEEGLADFERQFRENTKIELFDGKLNAVFVCSVKPIQVGQATVYQRRWVVKPGPPRDSGEEWHKQFDPYFTDLPVPKNSFVSFEVDATDTETGEPDIGIMTYNDKETGKPVVEFRVFENWYVEPTAIEREIREMSYQSLIYDHPLSGEKIEAERVTVRTWSADENWQKTRKKECQVQVLVFFEDWSPEVEEPSEVERVLEESVYEQFRGKDVGVWDEKSRLIFQGPGEKTLYVRNRQGKMVLVHLEGEPEDLTIPKDLGLAHSQYFL